MASGRTIGDLTLDPMLKRQDAGLIPSGLHRSSSWTPLPTTKIMTKKQATVAIIAMLGAVAFGSNAAAEQKFQKLTGAQIQAKFPGMELTDEAHWGEVFERNGTLTITSMGHKSVGKWRTQKDQLCLDTGKEPGGGCYEVWVSGKNVELRNQASSVPLEAVLQKPTDGR
jgi:hypothetical protein